MDKPTETCTCAHIVKIKTYWFQGLCDSNFVRSRVSVTFYNDLATSQFHEKIDGDLTPWTESNVLYQQGSAWLTPLYLDFVAVTHKVLLLALVA